MYAVHLQVVPPAFGVDISPIVWVAFLSFLKEILTSQQVPCDADEAKRTHYRCSSCSPLCWTPSVQGILTLLEQR